MYQNRVKGKSLTLNIFLYSTGYFVIKRSVLNAGFKDLTNTYKTQF